MSQDNIFFEIKNIIFEKYRNKKIDNFFYTIKMTELRLVPDLKIDFRVEGVLNGRYCVLPKEDIEIVVKPKSDQEYYDYLKNIVNNLNEKMKNYLKSIL